MEQAQKELKWEEASLQKYNEMLKRLPVFHREITRQVVDKQTVINARERNAVCVEEQDIIRAFLSEVPAAFYSLMVRIMDVVGFDYKQYES